MKKLLKYVYCILIITLACFICAKLPTLELTHEIRVADTIDYNCSYLKLESGYAISQAFVPTHDKIKMFKVYPDMTMASSCMEMLVIEVVDADKNIVYMKKLPRESVYSYRWQNVVSDLELHKGEVYFLRISMQVVEGAEAGIVRLATKETGRLYMQITYEELLAWKEYYPFYILTILLATFLVVHGFHKFE